MHASQAHSRILPAQAPPLPLEQPFFSKKRVSCIMQILSSGKAGASPCKSGQLEKEFGLEASSLRHAARLIVFRNHDLTAPSTRFPYLTRPTLCGSSPIFNLGVGADYFGDVTFQEITGLPWEPGSGEE